MAGPSNRVEATETEANTNRIEVEVRDTAFRRRIETFAIVNNDVHFDVDVFLLDAYSLYEREISRIIERKNMVKTLTVFVAEFEKKIIGSNPNEQSENQEPQASGSQTPQVDSVGAGVAGDNIAGGANDPEERIITHTVYLSTPNCRIGMTSNLEEHYLTNVSSVIEQKMEEAAFQGSGYTLKRIVELQVLVFEYDPLNASSHIPTPPHLRSKNAIVNVKNSRDEMCFKWSILSALYHDKIKNNAQKLYHYKNLKHNLNFDGIDFPVCIKDIDKFENQNLSISINVYYYDEDKKRICPLRLTAKSKEHHIQLILLYSELEEDRDLEEITTAGKIREVLNKQNDLTLIRSHYCWIKNLNRLVSRQLNRHRGTILICDRCLNFFYSHVKFGAHMQTCTNECVIEMPDEKSKWLEFKNHQNKLKKPFIIYADTESILKPLGPEERNKAFSEGCTTQAYQEHVVYRVGYFFKCTFDDGLSFYQSSGTGPCGDKGAIDWFVVELERLAKFAACLLNLNTPMKQLTAAEQQLMTNPFAKCSICSLHFQPLELRVRDHCHLTGCFRGPAHVHCNLNFQDSRTIPVVMHNLSKYDAHLFIKQLASQMDGDISVLANNSEEYITIRKVVQSTASDAANFKEMIKLQFIDSIRFLPASLAKLTSLLPSNKKKNLYKECERDYTKEQIKLLERKGVFPCDYVDSFDRLKETSLPPLVDFYSELNEENVSAEDYKFAQTVWNKFDIKTLGEYGDLYLKTDVLLLADVFENFREKTYEIYELDPVHYLTLPGFSFDAMMKYTGAKIELLTDVEMLLFVERGVRGGITQCTKRHVKANNKYMNDLYKPNEPSIYLMDLDGKIF